MSVSRRSHPEPCRPEPSRQEANVDQSEGGPDLEHQAGVTASLRSDLRTIRSTDLGIKPRVARNQ
jgi:hypothetical protein